jgi:RNA polymerase sigma factor (sigma-70 family)
MTSQRTRAGLTQLFRAVQNHPAQEQTDGHLLRLFLTQRDESAFSALVRRHGPMVFSVCRRVSGNSSDAEDAFQATFLVLVQKAASLQSRTVLGDWLHGVAFRTALNARRLAARRRLKERALARPEACPEEAHDDWLVWLDEALHQLPEKYRLPLVLCDLEGWTRREAAERLGWPEGTVAGRLIRGREMLARRLARHGLSSPGSLALVLSPAVPLSLVEATVRTSRLLALGQAPVAAILSARVADLAERVTRAMNMTRLITVTGALLMLGVVTLACGALLGRQPDARAEKLAGRSAEGPQEARFQPALDTRGDPLPDGAACRMGTVRLRHPGGVSHSIFLPDGKTLVSAGGDWSLRFWDLATGKEVRRLAVPTEYVQALTLSPDGSLLAGVSNGIRVWDIVANRERAHFPPPAGRVECFGWSPDAKTLVVGVEDGSVRFLDLVQGRETCVLAWHKKAVRFVAFSRDGGLVASGASDGTIRLARTKNLDHPRTLRAREKEYHFLAFARDGKTLISGGDCYGDEISSKVASVNTVAIWNVTTGERVRDFRVGDDVKPDISRGAPSMTLAADGRTLALGYWDHTIRLWDLATGKPIRKLTGYPDRFYPAYRIAFSPDGRTLAACGSNHAVCLLDVATGKQLHEDTIAHKRDIRCIAWSPDGRAMATASPDFTVVLWDAATGRPRRELRGHTSWVYCVAFSPDGRQVASAGSDDTVRLWDAATGKPIRVLATEEKRHPEGGPGSMFYVTRICFSPDGRVLAASQHGGTSAGGVYLQDSATGKLLRRLPGISTFYGSMTFSPDGTTLVVGGDPGNIIRYRGDTGKELSRFTVPAQETRPSISLSSDGTLAVSNPYDGPTQVWEVASGKLLLTIPMPGRKFVRSVFSPDGRYLALCEGSYDAITRPGGAILEVVELASGRSILRRSAPPRVRFISAAFSADGLRLATGMEDTTALLWNLPVPRAAKGSERLEDLWSALGSDDAEAAWRAGLGLAATADRAVPFLSRRLRPVTVDRERIGKLISDLDDDALAVRTRAYRELEELRPVAGAMFRAALAAKPSPEARKRLRSLCEGAESLVCDGEVLRGVRAIGVLERVGSPEARELLRRLVRGEPEARVTRDATAALERWAR